MGDNATKSFRVERDRRASGCEGECVGVDDVVGMGVGVPRDHSWHDQILVKAMECIKWRD